MSDKLSILSPPASLQPVISQANFYIARARAEASLRAYRSDWQDFLDWARRNGLEALPASPEAVCLYLSAHAETLAVSTLARRLTSITRYHTLAGYSSPASTRIPIVGDTWKGIRRTVGVAQQGKEALLSDDVKRIVAACPDDLRGTRDKALLLMLFAAGARRSEVAAIHTSDVSIQAGGMTVLIRRSKTDQEGAGRLVGVVRASDAANSPVRALELWLSGSGVKEGFLFRSVDRWGHLSADGLNKDSVGLIVKRAAARSGMKVDNLGAHSLRAGCVSQCIINRVPEALIMKQTGHKSRAMLDKYVRITRVLTDSASAGLGL